MKLIKQLYLLLEIDIRIKENMHITEQNINLNIYHEFDS